MKIIKVIISSILLVGFAVDLNALYGLKEKPKKSESKPQSTGQQETKIFGFVPFEKLTVSQLQSLQQARARRRKQNVGKPLSGPYKDVSDAVIASRIQLLEGEEQIKARISNLPKMDAADPRIQVYMDRIVKKYPGLISAYGRYIKSHDSGWLIRRVNQQKIIDDNDMTTRMEIEFVVSILKKQMTRKLPPTAEIWAVASPFVPVEKMTLTQLLNLREAREDFRKQNPGELLPGPEVTDEVIQRKIADLKHQEWLKAADLEHKERIKAGVGMPRGAFF